MSQTPQPNAAATRIQSGVQSNVQGCVVLATNTGVGKTWVGCELAKILSTRGIRVRVRKPVETGCETQSPNLNAQKPERLARDATALWHAAGQIDPLNTICPWRFNAAIAPPQAAEHEGKTLFFNADIAPHLPAANASQALSNPTEFWLIEGAGGLLSPLTHDCLNIELARYTGLPVLLIAPDELGTLSSLFSAIEALHQRGIPLAGIVLNTGAPSQKQPPAGLDNRSTLTTWLPQLHPRAPLPPVFSVHTATDITPIADFLSAAYRQ